MVELVLAEVKAGAAEHNGLTLKCDGLTILIRRAKAKLFLSSNISASTISKLVFLSMAQINLLWQKNVL